MALLPSHIDLGGGIGIQYQEEELIDLQALAQWLKPLLDQRAPLSWILEPGRSIVADAGLLLTRVLHTKVAERKHFCVVDAAMNDLLRPSLYGAWQKIETVEPIKPDAPEIRYDVVGPICETGDFLGKTDHSSLSPATILPFSMRAPMALEWARTTTPALGGVRC